MTEPLSMAGLGLKFSTLLAGFVGAIVSLSFVVQLTLFARFSAILCGTFTATYCTPILVQYFQLGPATENGVAFLLGLTSMNLVPAVLNGAKWLQCNVGKILARKTGVDGGSK